MKEIEKMIHNHDCCMQTDKLLEAIEQYVIKARLEEQEDYAMESNKERISHLKEAQ